MATTLSLSDALTSQGLNPSLNYMWDPYNNVWIQTQSSSAPGFTAGSYYTAVAKSAGQSTAQSNQLQTIAQTYVAPTNYIQTSTLDPAIAAQYGITGTQVQTTNPSAANYVDPATLKAAQTASTAQQSFKLPDASTATGQVSSPNGTQYMAVPADPITHSLAQWFQIGDTSAGRIYTPVSTDLTPVTTATGPVSPISQTQFSQQQQTVTSDIANQKQQQYLASIPYTTVTNIDPTTGQTYTTQYQSVDPTVQGYANSADIQTYQQQAQQAITSYQAQQAQAQQQAQAVATQQAQAQQLAQQQAAATAASQAADTQAQQQQAAQNLLAQQQLQQQAAQNVQQVAANQIAAAPAQAVNQSTVTVGNKTYQTASMYAPNYISPAGLQQAQANYANQQADYNTFLNQYKGVDPTTIKDTGSVMADPTTGTIYQSLYPDMPNYIQAGTAWSQQETTLGAHTGQSQTTYNAYVANNQAQAQAQASDAAYRQATASGASLNTVTSPSKLPTVSGSSIPTMDLSSGITYYPYNGNWVQDVNPAGQGYMTPSTIKMNLPTIGATSSPITSPDGTTYYPMQQTSANPTASGWASSEDPTASSAYYANQQQYQNDQASYVDPSAYFKSPDILTSGAQGTTINGQSGMIQTVNPYAPGYVSSNTLSSAQQNAQQNAEAKASSDAASHMTGLGPILDGFLVGLDKTVGQVIPGGWGTLATIAGSVVAGPLGATIANATAGAIKGETPGQILQGAALTFAMAYGTQALTEALTPAIDAANSGIADGTIIPSTETVPPLDVSTGADGTTTISTSTGTTATVDPTSGTITTSDGITGTTTTSTVDPTTGSITTVDPVSGSTIVSDPTAGTITTTDASGITTTEPITTQPVAPVDTSVTGPVEPTAPTTPTNYVQGGDVVGGGEATTPVSPQAPYNINSTGVISDAQPGTLLDANYQPTNDLSQGVNIVTDSGKVVPMNEWTAAQASGQPISVDGNMQTGVTIQLMPPEPVPAGPVTPSTSVEPTTGGASAPDYSNMSVDNTGNIVDKVTGENYGPAVDNGFTPQPDGLYSNAQGSIIGPTGLTGTQIAAVAAGATTIAAIAAAASGGGGAGATAATTPVAPTPVTPTTVTPITSTGTGTTTPVNPADPGTTTTTDPTTGTSTTTDPTTGTSTTTSPGGTSTTTNPATNTTTTTTPDGTSTTGTTTTPTGPVSPSDIATGAGVVGTGAVATSGGAAGGSTAGGSTAGGSTAGTATGTTTTGTGTGGTTGGTGTTPGGTGTTPTTTPTGTTTTVQTPNGPVQVHDYSSPYTNPDGTPVDTSGMSTSDILKALALGYIIYKVTQPVPTTDATKQQWWPIPTYNGAGLVNPGVNPGFIEPSSPYNMNAQPGVDQYYWGQHQYAQQLGDLANLNSPAPQTPYGNPNAVNLGQLLTPQQIGYPNQQTNAAAFGPGAQGQYAQQTYNSVLGQDTYNNQVQMNTAPPPIPGFGAAYNIPTNAQMAQGSGLSQQYGNALNYAWTPAYLTPTGTEQTTVGGPGSNTPASQIYSVSPQQLSQQLLAAANAQAPT